MPTNIFDDQPTADAPPVPHLAVPPGTPPPPRPRRRSRLIPVAALTSLAALAGLGGYSLYRSQGQNQPSPDTTVSSYLVQAAPTRAKGECLDSSGSQRDNGALAALALKTTEQAVDTWTTGDTVPDNQVVAARPGLDLVVRVVQPDSFGTAGSAADTASVAIPAVAGLRDAAPLLQEANYLARAQKYTSEHATVEQQLSQARTGVTDGRTALSRLTGRRSHGSDVTGCVLALAGILGPGSDILVVSDLQDTRFTAPGNAQLAGSMKGVRLWIAQACPSGLPQQCQKQLDLFLGRLTPLGLSRSDVTTRRSELGAQIVHEWLGR